MWGMQEHKTPVRILPSHSDAFFLLFARMWQWSLLCVNGLMLPDKLMALECGETLWIEPTQTRDCNKAQIHRNVNVCSVSRLNVVEWKNKTLKGNFNLIRKNSVSYSLWCLHNIPLMIDGCNPGLKSQVNFYLQKKIDGHSSVVSPVVLFHFTASAQLHKVVTHVNLGLAGMPGDRFWKLFTHSTVDMGEERVCRQNCVLLPGCKPAF